MKSNQAFTLAEVLITLAIIGVIAAISVPSLIQKTNDEQLKVAFKKEYAVLNQAAGAILFDEAGGTFLGFGGNVNVGNYEDFLANSFSNHIKVIKKCYENASTSCWHGFYSDNLKWYDGTTGTTSPHINEIFSHTSMIVNDGALVSFGGGHHLAACTGTLPNVTSSKYCDFVSIDVNGFKKPNQYGKDIFMLILTPDGFQIPEIDNCATTGTTEDKVGYSCAMNIIGK